MESLVTGQLRRHYSEKFSLHGPCAQGVDWGNDESKMYMRYAKMLSVLDPENLAKPSLLDVGCGYGGLLQYAEEKHLSLDYTGIDVAANMVEWAVANLPTGTFIQGDVMSHPFGHGFDYIVCNGILTQKLDVPGLEMDQFAGKLIRRLFSLCGQGMAFNIMTTKVNFFANNLYYRNPAELLAWCISEITPYVKLDHAYPLYEYTIYLYRNPAN